MGRKISGLLVLVLLTAGCGRAEFGLVSTSDELVEDILASGATPAVAECVQGMAIHDERLTKLDLSDAGDKTYVEDLQDSCERAEDLAKPEPPPPEEIPFAGPQTYGDDPTLDRLWDECEAGDGYMCDALFETAPVDSEYETFGVTCGNRPGVFSCSEELTRDDE